MSISFTTSSLCITAYGIFDKQYYLADSRIASIPYLRLMNLNNWYTPGGKAGTKLGGVSFNLVIVGSTKSVR